MKYLIPNLWGILFLFFLYSCQKEGSVESSQRSEGSLRKEISGECLSKTVSGVFVVDQTLTDSNYILVDINVTTTGPYTIYTDTVNGYFFRESGLFTQTGINQLKMKAIGKPITAGTDDFVVFYDTSFCLVPITVQSEVTGNDHLPLTTNSWWSYIDPEFPNDDTLTLRNIKTGQVAGKEYHFIQFEYGGFNLDTIYYRKSGNDYFEYRSVDNYSLLTFDIEQKAEFLFLKEGLRNGDTWQSVVYTGTVNGQSVRLRYTYKCEAANVPATVNGKSFSDVYKISFKPQVSILPSPFTDEGITYEAFYAKGVGLVYFKEGAPGAISETEIADWKVF